MKGLEDVVAVDTLNSLHHVLNLELCERHWALEDDCGIFHA